MQVSPVGFVSVVFKVKERYSSYSQLNPDSERVSLAVDIICHFSLVPVTAQLYLFDAPDSVSTVGVPVVLYSVAQQMLGSRSRVVRIRAIFVIVWRLSNRFVIILAIKNEGLISSSF